MSITINNNNTNSKPPDLPQTQSNNFPTLQTMLNQSTKLPQPQPPPLLNGILFLDKMLTKSSVSNGNKTHTVTSPSTNNGGWYNNTSNYQTRASIV